MYIAYVGSFRGDVLVETPHNGTFHHAIRVLIPKDERKWTGKVWQLKPRWYRPALDICDHFFVSTHDTYTSEDAPAPPDDWPHRWQSFLDGEATSATRKEADASSYDRLFLTPDAPPEVIKAAYRALTKIHHPDAGGDAEEFRKIDEAYRSLQPKAEDD